MYIFDKQIPKIINNSSYNCMRDKQSQFSIKTIYTDLKNTG